VLDNLGSHELSNVACWEPLGEQIVSLPACLCKPIVAGGGSQAGIPSRENNSAAAPYQQVEREAGSFARLPPKIPRWHQALVLTAGRCITVPRVHPVGCTDTSPCAHASSHAAIHPCVHAYARMHACTHSTSVQGTTIPGRYVFIIAHVHRHFLHTTAGRMHPSPDQQEARQTWSSLARSLHPNSLDKKSPRASPSVYPQTKVQLHLHSQPALPSLSATGHDGGHRTAHNCSFPAAARRPACNGASHIFPCHHKDDYHFFPFPFSLADKRMAKAAAQAL
jgi:hypothetical protein